MTLKDRLLQRAASWEGRHYGDQGLRIDAEQTALLLREAAAALDVPVAPVRCPWTREQIEAQVAWCDSEIGKAMLRYLAASLSGAGTLDALKDAQTVYTAMLRGDIATPSIRQMLHLHGEDALKRWDASGAGMWQPMETAPKNGTQIVLWRDAPSSPIGGYWDSTKIRWTLIGLGRVVSAYIDEDFKGWMPLPAPPSPRQEG